MQQNSLWQNDFSQLLKQEYRDGFNWIKQFSNIILSLFWFLMIWSTSVVILFGIAFLTIVFTTPELTFSFSLDYEVFRNSVKHLLFWFGVSSALVIVLLGLPKKLRNVFKDAAQNRLHYKIKALNELESQVQTTESLLLQYNLITQDAINKRQTHLQAKQNS